MWRRIEHLLQQKPTFIIQPIFYKFVGANIKLISFFLLISACRSQEVEPLLPNREIKQSLQIEFSIDTSSTRHNHLLTASLNYANELIGNRKDIWGPEKTPLLASYCNIIDKDFPSSLPDLENYRNTDRTPNGTNVLYDQDLFRLLYLLSFISNDSTFINAANDGLTFIMQNRNERTGFIPWGEHIYWDLMKDHPDGKAPWHELSSPLAFFDLLMNADPSGTLDYSNRLWRHQIHDRSTGEFSRHANFYQHGPLKGKEFPRHGGIYIRTWAESYYYTGNSNFLRYISTLLGYYERQFDHLGYIPHTTTQINELRPMQNLAFLLQLIVAERHLDQNDELAKRLRRFIQKNLDPTLNQLGLRNYQEIPKIIYSGQKVEYYQHSTHLSFAIMGYEMYKLTEDDAVKAFTLEVINASTQVNRDPGDFSKDILSKIILYRLGEASHLDEAVNIADEAIARLLDLGPLPRADIYSQHYETISGGPSLMFSLVYLWLEINFPYAVDYELINY
jgi:hypothetical protein